MSRRLRWAALCAAVMAVVASGNVVQAKSVTCDEAGNCVVRCSQTLSNGTFIEYDEGTEITATDSSGRTVKFRCVKGQWVQQAGLQVGGGLFGNFTDTNIGSFEIAPEEDLVVDPRGSKGITYEGPRSLFHRPDFGGCDPNTVGCPG